GEERIEVSGAQLIQQRDEAAEMIGDQRRVEPCGLADFADGKRINPSLDEDPFGRRQKPGPGTLFHRRAFFRYAPLPVSMPAARPSRRTLSRRRLSSTMGAFDETDCRRNGFLHAVRPRFAQGGAAGTTAQRKP